MKSKTDLRIISLYHKGIKIERIAKRIGRPGDIKRVKETLINNGILKNKPKICFTEIMFNIMAILLGMLLILIVYVSLTGR